MSTADQRPTASTVAEHLAGSKDSWHGKISPDGPFLPENDRYHLYIGLFCPFAHRVNLIRHLKNLTSTLPISIVKAYPKGDEDGWPGWQFPKSVSEYPGATLDHLFGSKYLHEVYFKADPNYKGRYSVPLLWDKKTQTAVNNESHELLRNLNTAFNDAIQDEQVRQLDFYPKHLQGQIDKISEWMQRDLNTGVYKAGFAPSQEEYDTNVLPVFAALNKIERIIAENGGPFVLGKELTELDLRLYPTIIRFDVVYVQHFKCNLGTIRANYPQIHNWMKGLFWSESELDLGEGSMRKVWGFGEFKVESLEHGGLEGGTVDFKHIKENYTKSHAGVNPKGITPRGPWPNVERGFETDFSKIGVGGIQMEEVIDLESKLSA